jgi:hypothetical protein
MTTLRASASTRFLVLVAVLAFLMGAAGSASGSWFSSHLGYRVHVGLDAPAHTAAQIQATGEEGGIALVTHESQNHAENYLVGFQPLYPGSPMYKNFSISTLVRNPDPITGHYVTRFNTAYLSNGRQRDDIWMLNCGGNGILLHPASPWGTECLGPNTTAVNGELHIRGALILNGRRIE